MEVLDICLVYLGLTLRSRKGTIDPGNPVLQAATMSLSQIIQQDDTGHEIIVGSPFQNENPSVRLMVYILNSNCHLMSERTCKGMRKRGMIKIRF